MGWMGRPLVMVEDEEEEIETIYKARGAKVLHHEIDKGVTPEGDLEKRHWMIVEDGKTRAHWLVLVKVKNKEGYMYYKVLGEEDRPTERVPEPIKKRITWPARNTNAAQFRKENGIVLAAGPGQLELVN